MSEDEFWAGMFEESLLRVLRVAMIEQETITAWIVPARDRKQYGAWAARERLSGRDPGFERAHGRPIQWGASRHWDAFVAHPDGGDEHTLREMILGDVEESIRFSTGDCRNDAEAPQIIVGIAGRLARLAEIDQYVPEGER